MIVLRVLGDVVGVDVRDELAAPLRLARGEERVGRVIVEERRVVDGVQVGQPFLPVVGVALVGDVLPCAGAHRERARADGVLDHLRGRVLERRPDVLGHDRGLSGDLVEVRHRRLVEGEGDLVVALLDDALDDLPVRLQVGLRVLLQQREAEHDIGGGERLPVRPFHARPDGERQRLVVRAPLVVAREPGRLLVVQEVVVDERLVQDAEGLAVHRAVVRIEVALPQRTALVVDRQHAPDCLLGVVVVARRTTSAGARQQRERRQGADEKVASSHSFPPECPIIPRVRDVQPRSACLHTAAFCACRAVLWP